MSDTRCQAEGLPAHIESELARLYGNVFSSPALFSAYGWRPGRARVYETREGADIDTLLLYEGDTGLIKVLNEGLYLDEARINAFARHVFANNPSAEAIRFHALETDLRHCPYPYQRHNILEDFTLRLPGTPEHYLASLGKATRRNIRRYGTKLARDFDSVRVVHTEGPAIEAESIARIVEFNHQRMARKGKHSVLDRQETERLTELARRDGLLTRIYIDGELAAGGVSLRAGRAYFQFILAHDPRFDDHRLGFLCSYQSIAACIERGATEFHFLWGRYDDKYLLGAQPRHLDTLVIYRSVRHAWHHAGLYLRIALQGQLRRAKQWFLYADKARTARLRWLAERLRTGRSAAKATGRATSMLGSLALNVMNTAEP